MHNTLILGPNGMLGDALQKVIPEAHICRWRYPSNEFKNAVRGYDYIINAAGAIPQRTNDFSVNTFLPIWLEKNTSARIIHPSSDCENDDTDYGFSKQIATEWLKSYAQRTKIIKSSIIGIDKEAKSLLSWALNQKYDCDGYTQAIWSGITTVAWAQIAQQMIRGWNCYNQCQIYHTSPISKCELIRTIRDVWGLPDIVTPVEKGKDKTMIGLHCGDIREQLEELKKIYG